jgi:hypothetical protein
VPHEGFDLIEIGGTICVRMPKTADKVIHQSTPASDSKYITIVSAILTPFVLIAVTFFATPCLSLLPKVTRVLALAPWVSHSSLSGSLQRHPTAPVSRLCPHLSQMIDSCCADSAGLGLGSGFRGITAGERALGILASELEKGSVSGLRWREVRGLSGGVGSPSGWCGVVLY